MTRKPKQPPHRSAQGEAAAARRQARLGDALRANLGRRKAQARQRETEDTGGDGPEDASGRTGA